MSRASRGPGNITGVTYVHDTLAGKSVELLKQAAPSVPRAAILWNPNHTDPEYRETQRPRMRWESISSGSRCEGSVTLKEPTTRLEDGVRTPGGETGAQGGRGT